LPYALYCTSKRKFKLSSKRVLITGISGFVGPYLARKLLEGGHEVFGFVSRRADGNMPPRLKELGIIDEVKLCFGDIADLTNILSAIQSSQPDWIFHLAAQSYVVDSFRDPLSTFRVNCLGTQNLLEAVKLKDAKPRVLFAGSSEEYGLQFKDSDHFEKMKKKYGVIEPLPNRFPEIPVDEEGPLRPMSPYATSKVFGDYAFRNYHNSFNLDTIVSRAFNHEGAGRGPTFVTSTVIRQLVSMHLKETDVLRIGDIESFRDWSHVEDIVEGYVLLAKSGISGSVYVQGSNRSNSVLSYILYAITALGYTIDHVETLRGEKIVHQPLEKRPLKVGDLSFVSNAIDEALLTDKIKYDIKDEGLRISTNKREFKVKFDAERFRPSDVPILMSNIDKITRIGFKVKHSLMDIINDQINYYLDPLRRTYSTYE
jgi:GDPmannose 4,6-dehydratase